MDATTNPATTAMTLRTFWGVSGSAVMPVDARDERHAAELFARMRMCPDEIRMTRNGPR